MNFKIEYICHSCLHIETDDTSLVIDPWFKGSAYCNQWFLFPLPVDLKKLSNVKNILFSHGHEDHLHSESLSELPNNAEVFFPYQWRNGVKEFFSAKHFHLTEAESFTSYRLSPSTKITYIAFALESVIVIEIDGYVIVNLNDALNSHHENVVQWFISRLKKRWKKIDLLFSGWSGAGYFPNMVHYKTKDDVETGKRREQYFANHFCKIVRQLQPAAAVPFAPGFVLLKKDRQWINEVKFPRGIISDYYKKYFDRNSFIRFETMYPGDSFDNNGFNIASPYHKKLINGSLNHLIEETYADEILESNKTKIALNETIDTLVIKLRHVINSNRDLYDSVVLYDACFSILLEDVSEIKFINVSYENNYFLVERSEKAAEKMKLQLRTTSTLLLHSVEHEWGGDALTIGYGMHVDVFDESALEKNLDMVCVRLLTRFPTTTKSLRRDPFRAMKYFIKHPLMSKLALMQKLRLKNSIVKYPYNERDHWLTFTKCELCQVCNMPLLSYEFESSIKS